LTAKKNANLTMLHNEQNVQGSDTTEVK